MKQIRELGWFLRENGPRWTLYFITQRAFSAAASRLDASIVALEKRKSLPGTNSVSRNYALWNFKDWSEGGEEWSHSPAWKQSLIDEVMHRRIDPDKEVLEIGPGAGRWTEPLAARAKRLVVVDISDRCIELCRTRFAATTNIEYYVNDGRSLPFLADASLDAVWSFDAFVHISPQDTEAYLAEFARVLRPGGRAVIHHGRDARARGGYRSSMTAKLFIQLLRKHQLTLVSQFDSWGPQQEHDVKLRNDVITVFEK